MKLLQRPPVLSPGGCSFSVTGSFEVAVTKWKNTIEDVLRFLSASRAASSIQAISGKPGDARTIGCVVRVDAESMLPMIHKLLVVGPAHQFFDFLARAHKRHSYARI